MFEVTMATNRIIKIYCEGFNISRFLFFLSTINKYYFENLILNA